MQVSSSQILHIHLSSSFAVMPMEQMMVPYYYYGLCFSLALFVHVVLCSMLAAAAGQPRPRLPPGLWQLQVIGSLHHQLRGLPHHAMRGLSLHHGPLMLLRVCERVVIVVSSAEAVREICRGHDTTFLERPSSLGIDKLSQHGQGIIFAPYGDHWHMLRRILMTELFSARCVEAFRRIREDEAAHLVSALLQTATSTTSPQYGAGLININEWLGEFVTSSAVRAIFGGLLKSAAFMKMVKQVVDLSLIFDLRDLFPLSRLVRLLLPRRGGKVEWHQLEMFWLMDNILKTHESRRAPGRDDGEQGMVFALEIRSACQSIAMLLSLPF